MSNPMYFPPAPFQLSDAVSCSDLVDIAHGTDQIALQIVGRVSAA